MLGGEKTNKEKWADDRTLDKLVGGRSASGVSEYLSYRCGGVLAIPLRWVGRCVQHSRRLRQRLSSGLAAAALSPMQSSWQALDAEAGGAALGCYALIGWLNTGYRPWGTDNRAQGQFLGVRVATWVCIYYWRRARRARFDLEAPDEMVVG